MKTNLLNCINICLARLSWRSRIWKETFLTGAVLSLEEDKTSMGSKSVKLFIFTFRLNRLAGWQWLEHFDPMMAKDVNCSFIRTSS